MTSWAHKLIWYVPAVVPVPVILAVRTGVAATLGVVELDFADAKTFKTPLGPRERTAEAVRAAVAALRDPYQRLLAELWARNAPPVYELAPAPENIVDAPTGLRRSLGWRP